jgi:AcrR family transcriptional regulator
MPKVLPEYREQARRRIVKIATAELAKKGYHNVSMSEIAKKVGVSKAAIYEYFENKESLAAVVAVSILESALKTELSEHKDQPFLRAIEGSFDRLLKSMPGTLPGIICDLISEAHQEGIARRALWEFEEMAVRVYTEAWEANPESSEIPAHVDMQIIVTGMIALQVGLLAEITAGTSRQEAIEVWIGIVRIITAGLDGGKKISDR